MNSEEQEQEKFEAWVQHALAVAKEGDVKALIRESLSNYQSVPFWVLPVTYEPTLKHHRYAIIKESL